MLKEFVNKSCSYRGYDESWQIAREELMELVDYARYAPLHQIFLFIMPWRK